jgi:fatty-acyl-CoA synthase
MIGRQLSVNAERFPDAVAVVFGARRVSYAELNARACRLANALAMLGIGRGDRIATLMHNCDAFVEIFFAAAKIGAVFAPLNFRLVEREIRQLLDACAPKVLFAGETLAPVVDSLRKDPGAPRHLVMLADSPAVVRARTSTDYERLLGAHGAGEPDVEVGIDEVQMLLHSSGTTGLPKGAVFAHATTWFSSMAKIIDFGLTRHDTTVVFGPLFHAGPLLDLAVPLLLRGGRLVIGASRQFDPERLLRTLADERGTAIPIYPTMLRRVVAVPGIEQFDLSSLRLILTGGEAAPVPVIRAVHERFPGVAFVNNYGSTEGGPITTFLPPEDSLRKTGSVGRPAFGVELRIADPEGEPLPRGQVGEILVRSPFVCRGYWNRPEATAESLRGGWWRTSDLGRRDDEGDLWIGGRSKDMIKSGTENIYPIEIEQVIAALDGVAETAVVGVPDDEWGESVAAFVVAAPGALLDAARVIEHCRAHLASYKKPRHVRFVESLPRTTVNKVAKDVLRAQFSA